MCFPCFSSSGGGRPPQGIITRRGGGGSRRKRRRAYLWCCFVGEDGRSGNNAARVKGTRDAADTEN